MTDTPDPIRKKQLQVWLSLPEAERFKLGFDMIDEVNDQIRTRIREQQPHLNDKEVTAEFIRQMYKNELPAAYLENVLRWVRSHPAKQH
jgi:CYTH domain-containing protein